MNRGGREDRGEEFLVRENSSPRFPRAPRWKSFARGSKGTSGLLWLAWGEEGNVGFGLLLPDVEELEEAPLAPVRGVATRPRSGDRLAALGADRPLRPLALVPNFLFDLALLLEDVAARIACPAVAERRADAV